MDWLNYHHLHYFWLVAKEGSLTRAAARLHLSPATISSQLRQLEAGIGQKLFRKAGRNLVLTEFGHTAFRYADEIFALGREFQGLARGDTSGQTLRFVVGISQGMPKLIAHELLMPAFQLEQPVHIVCYEDVLTDLLTELALHRLDVVLADSPLDPAFNIRAYNHFLGDCGVSFFASSARGAKYRSNFPASLHQAPILLPIRSATRRAIDHWFDEQKIQPRIVGEFEDSALMKVYGQDGLGLFPTPTVIEKEVCRQYNVQVVGRAETVRERYYAISAHRRLKHPAVVAICNAARTELFKHK